MAHRILILTTYPIKNPRHGGQKRTYAIYEAYKKQFSQVRHSAVFFKGFYNDHDSDDIALGPSGEQKIMQSPLTGDIVCGEAIYEDPVVKAHMTRLLQEFKPDIIHVEQPFPYLGLEPLIKELGLSPLIIFGSQNIEAPMKREILEDAGVDEAIIAKFEKDIDQLERHVTKVSDLVLACTASDVAVHKKMGAKQVVLAQNGIAPITTDQPAEAHWKNIFEKRAIKNTALFVASAHPPSWRGFLDVVGQGLGFVPYDSRIVIAGSIADYFEREIKTDNLDIADATFWLRAYSAGRLSENRLGGLITVADVMLLPITEGGGSNLKTAEAIIANKKVVTTTHALRSFEWFKDFPNVWVADTKPAFQQAIVEALATPFVKRTAAQQKQAAQVEWRYCLAAAVEAVKSL